MIQPALEQCDGHSRLPRANTEAVPHAARRCACPDNGRIAHQPFDEAPTGDEAEAPATSTLPAREMQGICAPVTQHDPGVDLNKLVGRLRIENWPILFERTRGS